jgi:type I restriction enzyme R subunit
VVRVTIDRDVNGYRPSIGDTDREGAEIPDRLYNSKDFDRTIVLDERTKLVAKKVSDYLKQSGDRFQKTIIFCVDQEHADRMRQALVNENSDLVAKNYRYVMRITGNDREGLAELSNFIDPESTYPVLVTTSRLLSTGVDAQTCRLIVLDREVGSMTEFKQILGRGTRVHEDSKKWYFTLIDFRGATNHFADPAFDGDPVQIYEASEDDDLLPPDIDLSDYDPEQADERVLDDPQGVYIPRKQVKERKLYINGVNVQIIAERAQYLDADGKLITESLRDFTKKALKQRFVSLDRFLQHWNSAQRKQAIIDELEELGLSLEFLQSEAGTEYDPFDLICQLAFDAKPLTRRERAAKVPKQTIYSKYGDKARVVLDALLAKYQDEGLLNLEDPQILRVAPFTSLGTPIELVKMFGGKPKFDQAVQELQTALYQESA